jgi:hypothetical protein
LDTNQLEIASALHHSTVAQIAIPRWARSVSTLLPISRTAHLRSMQTPWGDELRRIYRVAGYQ